MHGTQQFVATATKNAICFNSAYKITNSMYSALGPCIDNVTLVKIVTNINTNTINANTNTTSTSTNIPLNNSNSSTFNTTTINNTSTLNKYLNLQPKPKLKPDISMLLSQFNKHHYAECDKCKHTN